MASRMGFLLAWYLWRTSSISCCICGSREARRSWSSSTDHVLTCRDDTFIELSLSNVPEGDAAAAEGHFSSSSSSPGDDEEQTCPSGLGWTLMKDPKNHVTVLWSRFLSSAGSLLGRELFFIIFIIICHEITTLSEELLKAPSPGVPWMSLPVRRGDGVQL